VLEPPGIEERELVGTQGNSGELKRRCFSRTEGITDIKEEELVGTLGTEGNSRKNFLTDGKKHG
jgi:hypothetical protein